MRLANRVTFFTGASRGIGRWITGKIYRIDGDVVRI